MLTQEQQEQIIQAAIWAPSADNSQPFQFEWLSTDKLALYIDKKRSGKASDNRFVLSDIALGAVIENVVVKAEALFFHSEINYFPSQDDDYHVCTIYFLVNNTLDDNVENTNHLGSAIFDRHTDRRFPFKGPIVQNTIEALTSAGSNYNCSVKWFNNKTSIRNVLPVIQKAESIRFKSQKLHQELFSTVHFNEPKSEEGMPIDVLAIEKPAQPMFKFMKKWSVMNFFNKLGAYKMLGLRSVRIPISLSPALALICIPNNERQDVINGGRALQRFWLQATKENLAVHPFAAPGIFSLGFIDCEDEFKDELTDVGLMMKEHVVSGYGLMFFRIGYQNCIIPPRSNRRSIDSFKKLR